MKEYSGPRMYDKKASFANISLCVDPINRKRTEKEDNVMAIFYEEQPFMWEFVKEDIKNTIEKCKGEIDFLDVGTGSGVWAILVAKNSGAKDVLAIDKNKRAVEWAKRNAVTNGVHFNIRQELYNMGTAPWRSCKVIGIYPPYHLYPKEIENKIPQHARGGVDGQQAFREQLVIADYHLTNNGIIVFNQMCLGRNGTPLFVNYIPNLVKESSLLYTNIFPPTKTEHFLSNVYGSQYKNYVKETSRLFPELFYCVGIIHRNGKSSVKEVPHEIDLCGRTWEDRIKLHYEIAQHGLKG